MKSTRLLILLMITLTSQSLTAVEGMWMPVFISENIEDMKRMGLELSARDIYNDTTVSLKDAIVRFGRGCTGSFISPEGLLLTNHHCGYGQIQSHSSVEHNYLEQGFWAEDRSGELPNPGLTVTLLVRMEDVTDRVKEALTDDMTEDQRSAAIRRVSAEITQEASANAHTTAHVIPFYYGNEYFLFVYKIYNDVRLVGAPPSYIGKYGGDTDNWMWPRHSGDFALFRVYAGHDNEPADYHPDNIPFRPAHYLPVSGQTPAGYDFTMIMGYPGSTSQYLTSEAVSFLKQVEYPLGIDLRTTILGIYESEMQRSEVVRIQYASKHARVSNAWKKWQGEIRGLRRLDAITVKQMEEEAFNSWASQPANKRYAGLLDAFSETYSVYHPYRHALRLYAESVRNIELLRFSYQFNELVRVSSDESKSDDEVNASLLRLKELAERHFRDYDPVTDRQIAEAMLHIYHDRLLTNDLPSRQEVLELRDMQNLTRSVSRMYDRSMFTSGEKVQDFLENYRRRDHRKIKKDPAFALANNLETIYATHVLLNEQKTRTRLDSLYRIYTAALRNMQHDRLFYPDANGTMRLTYGRVEGSFPRDAVSYLPLSTTAGILDKASQSTTDDYRISEKLEGLLAERNFGEYATNGELVVNFIASNHTTGGNSGSPVLDASGHLIGLNFDRSWESTMSDIMFDPGQCRNISVNAPFILWVIDIYAGSGHLLEEMTIKR